MKVKVERERRERKRPGWDYGSEDALYLVGLLSVAEKVASSVVASVFSLSDMRCSLSSIYFGFAEINHFFWHKHEYVFFLFANS